MTICTYAVGCTKKSVHTEGGVHMCSQCHHQWELGGKGAHYTPTAEQSKAHRERGMVRPKDVEPGTCGCGCGEPVRKVFRPGHDAKLKAERRLAGLVPETGEPNA